MLAKEKEEAEEDRDQTKKLLDDLKRKYEVDATGCKVKVKQYYFIFMQCQIEEVHNISQ